MCSLRKARGHAEAYPVSPAGASPARSGSSSQSSVGRAIPANFAGVRSLAHGPATEGLEVVIHRQQVDEVLARALARDLKRPCLAEPQAAEDEGSELPREHAPDRDIPSTERGGRPGRRVPASAAARSGGLTGLPRPETSPCHCRLGRVWGNRAARSPHGRRRLGAKGSTLHDRWIDGRDRVAVQWQLLVPADGHHRGSGTRVVRRRGK